MVHTKSVHSRRNPSRSPRSASVSLALRYSRHANVERFFQKFRVFSVLFGNHYNSGSIVIASQGGLTFVLVDEMNLKILRLLMTDGRMSHIDVALRLHRSPSTIRDRIRRLEDEKIILGYAAIVNSEQIGMGVEGILFANLMDGVTSEKLKALAKVQGVQEVLQVTGGRRIMVRMVSGDNHALERTIEREVVPLGLKDLELHIVMESLMRFPGL